MSKCWYCSNELTSGDSPKHLGICNKCYDEMFKSGDTIIRSLSNKIAELQKQLEKYKNALVLDYSTREWRKIGEMQQENYQFKEAYKGLRKEYDERVQEKKQAHILNDRLGARIEHLERQLKSQPAEIVEKINGEIYTRMVVECKETKYTDINLILHNILKEYQK